MGIEKLRVSQFARELIGRGGISARNVAQRVAERHKARWPASTPGAADARVERQFPASAADGCVEAAP